ncbi:hypothetical protein ACR3I8_11560 [Priestia flexa]
MKKLVKMVTTVGLSIGLLAGHASVEAAGKIIRIIVMEIQQMLQNQPRTELI